MCCSCIAKALLIHGYWAGFISENITGGGGGGGGGGGLNSARQLGGSWFEFSKRGAKLQGPPKINPAAVSREEVVFSCGC